VNPSENGCKRFLRNDRQFGFLAGDEWSPKRFSAYAGIVRSRKEQALTNGVTKMGLGDLVQKAVYLGVGLASLAGEKAGETLGELRVQVQKMADEMVERGEMSTDEARKFVDDMLKKAQQPQNASSSSSQPSEPRRIEIVEDGDDAPPQPPQSGTSGSDVEDMRRRVMELQEELKRLKKL
jgi:polyhydroxyalkanoate synthesis regulator phasin